MAMGMDSTEENENGIIDILRLLVGLQGVSLIQQGYNLTTQQNSVWIILSYIQGISNILAGFLLVIIAIEPKLAGRILEFLLKKLGRE